jgi:hypothetical protein
VAAVVVVALVVGALGLPLGLLWAALAPDVPLIKTATGVRLTEAQPEQFIAADGWFTLLGFGFGILVAVAAWILLRRYRGPVGLLGVAIGTVGAGLLARWIGSRIGLSEYESLLAGAAEGTSINRPPELRAGGIKWFHGVIPLIRGDLLLPAFGAAVTYTLLAGWSRWPSLRPETEPDEVWVEEFGSGAGEQLSSRSEERPAPTGEPGPPVPDATEPPRG